MVWLIIVIVIILLVLYFLSKSGYEGFCNTGDKCLQITKKFCKCLRIMPEVSEPTEISTKTQNPYVDFKAERLDNYYQYFDPIQFDYVNKNKLNVGLYNKII